MKPILLLVCTVCLCQSVPAPAYQNAPGKEERRKLNTFFSNFAEAFTPPFTRAKGISNGDLIRFGAGHAHQNKGDLPPESGRGRASAAYMQRMALRYFGKRITKDESPGDGIVYTKGVYSVPFAEGDGVPFAQVDRVRALGHQEYQAEVSIYVPGTGWNGDRQALPATWRDGDEGPNSIDAKPKRTERMRALIRKLREQGETRYILLEYLPLTDRG